MSSFLYPSFGRTRVADEKNERRNVNCWREKERGAKGRGKVTGWTVGVKRKGKRKTAVSGKRADQTDIYICVYVFLYIYVSLFFFSFPSLSLLSPRLSRFSFTRLFAPSRASASRPPSVHCSNWNGIINRGPVTSRHLSSSRAINTIGRMVAMVVVHRSARLTRFVILPSLAALSLPNRHARGFVPFRFVSFRFVPFRSVPFEHEEIWKSTLENLETKKSYQMVRSRELYTRNWR